MARKKKQEKNAGEKEFDFSSAGFYFCAEVVEIYGQVNYRQSEDILMDQFVTSSIDAGQHITAFSTIPESLRTPAAKACLEYMDKTMYLAFLLVKLGLFREKAIEGLVALARAIKRNLMPYIKKLEKPSIYYVEDDDDGFYDNVDLSAINKH